MNMWNKEENHPSLSLCKDYIQIKLLISFFKKHKFISFLLILIPVNLNSGYQRVFSMSDLRTNHLLLPLPMSVPFSRNTSESTSMLYTSLKNTDLDCGKKSCLYHQSHISGKYQQRMLGDTEFHFGPSMALGLSQGCIMPDFHVDTRRGQVKRLWRASFSPDAVVSIISACIKGSTTVSESLALQTRTLRLFNGNAQEPDAAWC